MPRSVRGWDAETFWARCEAVVVPEALDRAILQADFGRHVSCYDAMAIPLLLRGLAADNETLRAQCLLRLADEIEHQGSTWESTKPVVLFLAQSLDDGLYAEAEPIVFGLLRTPNLWGLLPARWRKPRADRIAQPINRAINEAGEAFVPSDPFVIKRNGDHREFHANGALKIEGAYIDDLEQGLFREWDEAGELMLEQTFDHGKRHGLFVEWRGGLKRVEGAYVRGKRHGLFRTYDAAGIVTKTVQWTRGKPQRG